MPLDIGKSVNMSEPIRVMVALPDPWNETIWVDFRPAGYDWEIENILVNEVKRLPAFAVKEFLLKFVVDWDITLNGKKVSVDGEGIKLLDLFTIQMPIAEAIVDSISEGKALKTASPSHLRTVSRSPRKSKAKAPSQESH